MFLRQLDLTTALRPSLLPDETLLFVQDGVGLYEGKFKIPNYQNGHAYLTSHRVCYVDNEDPRKYSVAVDLKEIERTEFYAGFLVKSSPKVTLFPKPSRRGTQVIRSPVPTYPSLSSPASASPPRFNGSPARSVAPSPAPARESTATWICPICSFSNPVPSNFDPNFVNEHTPLPPCLACGIKPSLVHVTKAAIAALANRVNGATQDAVPQRHSVSSDQITPARSFEEAPPSRSSTIQCPRCTFQNHSSLNVCEICGASLPHARDRRSQLIESAVQRPESPGPTLTGSIIGDDTIETIKFSFRAGGEKVFLEKLKGAMLQRKWLLQSAPPVPKPNIDYGNGNGFGSAGTAGSRPGIPQQRTVGIAGLERRGQELRENNQMVIGTAFEDLEALMTSAKEVIAMAEQFAAQSDSGLGNVSAETQALLSESASALGLITTRDMLGSGGSSETLYISELSRNLAEYLTDDRKGILRREGGIMSLVDLWAVFNRTRNGIELVSPLDFERAANMWDTLRLPIRLRRFKSGLLVVQGRDRTDDKTIASLLAWLREPQYAFPPEDSHATERAFGRGVTAQEAAERFGWSVGVATEELEMAEEQGALCRDQLDGIKFWENWFMHEFPQSNTDPLQMLSELSI